MFKRILLLLDGSSLAVQAIPYAPRWSHGTGSVGAHPEGRDVEREFLGDRGANVQLAAS
jgi:hypothetical protein